MCVYSFGSHACSSFLLVHRTHLLPFHAGAATSHLHPKRHPPCYLGILRVDRLARMSASDSPPQPASGLGNVQQTIFGIAFGGSSMSQTTIPPIDQSGQKFACTFRCPGDLPAYVLKASNSKIFVFAMIDAPIPPNYGALVYCQATAVPTAAEQSPSPPYSTGLIELGSLTPTDDANSLEVDGAKMKSYRSL
jgi:hypothetical protein